MVKFFTGFLLRGLLFLCCLWAGLHANAQTVTIRKVDAGPYAPGSSIAAAITITDASGQLSVSNNKFELYLSDANGNFAAETKIGEFSGYYTGFINGQIPASAIPGTGYRVRVRTTSPATVSADAGPLAIVAGTGVQAGAASNTVSASNPEVYGTCDAKDNLSFLFSDESTAGSSVTANFYNDLAQSDESTLTLNPTGSFTAKTSNYTVFVKAVNNNVVGTKAYLLLNNFTSNSFQTQNASSVCLPENSAATVSYSMNITGAGGIQNNYPGTRYTIKWGDGSSTNFTYFQIAANNGILTHDYLVSSCGAKSPEGVITNRFYVSFMVANPYCPDQSKNVTGDQAVLSPPKTAINGPLKGCTNKEITFTNVSYAGQIVSSNAGGTSCENPNATFQWYVNGQPVAPFNSKKSVPLKYTFPAAGTYTITLKLTSSTPCTTLDAVQQICIQDPPKPDFDIPATLCTGTGSVSPTDKSVVSNPCANAIGYNWIVTPSTGFTYADGTSATSTVPKFVFNTPGVYSIQLEINNNVCDVVQSAVKTVTVSSAPVATLSADFSLCGKGQTLTFDNTPGSQTYTVLTGTVAPQPNTYQWTVTGQGGIAPATFVNGTTANSQYPQISFPAFGTYDVTVTHTNSCGPVASSTQHITFKEAPTVLAGPDRSLCAGDVAQLEGQVIGTYNTLVWTTSGTGTFNNANIEKPIYTPSNADRAAGSLVLTLTVTTSLPGDCATISDQVKFTVNPVNTITSNSTKTICTGTSVNYTPIASVPGSTFNWVVTASSPGISGITTTGIGNITDVLTNSSTTTAATVTYTITPNANGCDGTPFNFTVTVTPKPQVTLTGPANLTICSGSPAAVQVSANVPGTQYTWTVTSNGSVIGATDQTTPIATATIDQVLINTGLTAASVTYTVTPVNANSADACVGDSKSITITVQPQIPAAKAGDDDFLCNQPLKVLNGNDPGSSFSGTWTLTSNQTGVTFANKNQFNTTVNGLTGGQTYTFRWTITGGSNCTPQFDEVQVVNYLPVTNFEINEPASTLICSGNSIKITGKTAQGGNNTPLYQWQTSTDGGATWITLANETGRDIEIVVTGNTWFRRITTAGVCDAISNVVKFTVQPPITNNTIGTNQDKVCYNSSTKINNIGSLSGADDNPNNYTYQWQQHTSATAPWQTIAGANSADYTTPNLTVTTQYRRLVGSTLCSISESNTVEITVIQNSIAKLMYNSDGGCAGADLMTDFGLKAEQHTDTNQEYQWYVNNVLVGTGINFPVSYKLNNPGESVTVKLVTVSFNNCQPNAEDTHVFKTIDKFTLDFTASLPIVNNTITVCGTTKITFTNTSSPLSGATYNWNFGGATPASSQQIQPGEVTFTANAIGGDDKTYMVTLNGSLQCGIATPKTITVIVTPEKPSPIINASPKLQCGSLITTVTNLTNGTNKSYVIFVINAVTNQEVYRSGIITTKDPQSVSINAIGNFDIYMEATSLCGVQAISKPVRVQVVPENLTPLLQTAPRQATAGCAPLSVVFINNSSNITSYWYDWGDGSRSEVFNNTGNAIPAITHIYTIAGTFAPKLHVANNCTPDKVSDDVITIVVNGRPAPAFRSVNIESATCYTCTLVKFTNTTPDPNNNTTYTWDFGDGGPVSHDVNPQHEYDYNKGTKYSVKLTAINIYTCDATVTREVVINVPNTQLFLPNAFTPGSINTELNTFTAKGSGLREWHMRVFNNYGQMVWETTRLDSRGAPVDGWDGTFKGSPVPQGVYIWQVEARFINGDEWKGMSYNSSSPKRTGVIHLIR